MSIQKSLVTTLKEYVIILSEIHSNDFNVQSIVRKTADTAATLGETSNELFLKRRVSMRSLINNG